MCCFTRLLCKGSYQSVTTYLTADYHKFQTTKRTCLTLLLSPVSSVDLLMTSSGAVVQFLFSVANLVTFSLKAVSSAFHSVLSTMKVVLAKVIFELLHVYRFG